MRIYKIRHKETGLFSTGGTTPRWTKRGKIWTSNGSVRSHLRQFREPYYNTEIPEEWEVIEYEISDGVYYNALEFYDKTHKGENQVR